MRLTQCLCVPALCQVVWDTGPRGYSLAVHVDLMVYEGQGEKLGSYRAVRWKRFAGEPRALGNQEWKSIY